MPGMEGKGVLEMLRGRVDDLERHNRRLRASGTFALVLLGAFAVMGQALPARKTLEADFIILKDPSGNKRLELDGGAPRLVLYDDQGVPRASLDLSSGEPCLQLNDRSQTRKIIMGRGDGWEGKGQPGRFLESHEARFPSLEIVDQGVHPNIILGAYQSFSRPDPAQHKAHPPASSTGTVVPITTYGGTRTGLVLFDWDGDRTVSIQGHQYAGVSIEDKSSNTSAMFGMAPAFGPGFAPLPPILSLKFSGDKGQSVWRAP